MREQGRTWPFAVYSVLVSRPRFTGHARDGRVFDQVRYTDELGTRVAARDLEGSALNHARGSGLENAARKDGGYYHSCDPEKLAEGRTFLSQDEIDRRLSKANVRSVDNRGSIKGNAC